MHRTALALVLVAIAGCGGPKLTIDPDYEPSTDFSKYKSWAWLPGMKVSDKDIDNLTEQRIRSAIEAELPRHGLAKAGENPDIHAAFHISLRQKVEASRATVSLGYGWGPAHVGVSKNPTRTINEGTLVLDLVDAKTKTLIWRSTANGSVDPNSTPEERSARINEVVGHMLADYPPKK